MPQPSRGFPKWVVDKCNSDHPLGRTNPEQEDGRHPERDRSEPVPLAAPLRIQPQLQLRERSQGEHEHQLSRQTVLGTGIAAAALTAAALAVANFVQTGSESNGGGPEYAATLAVSLLVALALFGWAIPRIARPAHTGLAIGVIALLSVGVFWTGLPFVLGRAAVVLGLLGSARAGTRAPAKISVVLGTLATAGAIAAIVLDLAQ